MADRFEHLSPELSDPSSDYFDITPSDGTDFDQVTRGVYVGGSGDLAAVRKDDNTVVVFHGVLAGTLLPIRAKRINSTGTTATDIVGLA
ncbi:hypothetical protein QMT40_001794 [Parvibaculaceae bacterium PLY_AMNH_Bact1]|nr:hypothetical protein QMT40_001794 [Parvibaculaceae bacterium PLY_AMNH_Bact1]